MRDHRLIACLVLLVFSTSLNQGQKVKANDRRAAAGLVPYPRIGRNSDMTNFPRSDRASGLVHYPRVGRSDLPVLNFNRYHDLPPENDLEFYAAREAGPEPMLDLDYEGYFSGKPVTLKYGDKLLRDGAWLTAEHVRKFKEIHPAQKAEDSRTLYLANRGGRNTQGQVSLNDYVPRLGRETENDGAMSYL